MDQQQAKELLEKYNAGNCTAEEKAWLETWYNEHNESKSYYLPFDTLENATERIWAKLNNEESTRTRNLTPWKRFVAAASIALTISAGGYFILHKAPKDHVVVKLKNDLNPGTSGAILTLANGKKIILEQAKVGTIAQQNGVGLRKADNNSLVYQAGEKTDNFNVSYNTLETPKGRQCSVLLPDGTQVWLNAASSLRYPTTFTGKERVVELRGEGYFEVVHDDKMPFKVKTSNQVVEDIGTHFNVNAYTDENEVKTTLLEGRVKITTHPDKQIVQQSAILKPGQQSTLNNMGITIQEVNVEDAVAWKNGCFKFNQEDLHSIMRKLSRWYDIDVVFETEKDPTLIFGGKISQTKSINIILQVMEETGNVHFKVEGRRVIVMQ